ncbi:MAG: outer membrane protein assembly factor BamE [Candidatus Andeanibacterium colombiense]|uniref:Outer membrane protein assembly factor BamE n=1 Tax=Candidatus Andeanibacterium colombiense TaxID=3121345 RepID=A0AAJ5X548_9SPHN|nr:MAG: outer membrane protein assembly factor BamE [Sphingomonadaceae bacterium]
MKAPRKIGFRIGIAALMAAGLAGCSSIADHRGYVVDPSLTQAIQPGIDNRQSVEGTLGRPTFTSEYGDKIWYYVSSVAVQRPFGRTRIRDHYVLAISFDDAGNVKQAENWGPERLAYLTPDSAKTPVLGKERGFLEDLFGNIGQVGSFSNSGGQNGGTGTGPNGS